MRRLLRFLVRVFAVLAVLALLLVGVRAVNGWRYPPGDGPDPTAMDSYDTTQDGVTITPVADGPVRGFHVLPAEPGAVTRSGAVVAFGGSEGGTDLSRAVDLARQGHEVYALFFFGQPEQPPALEEVPLEFFAAVLDRIERTAVAPGPLTVIGSSKGAELALVLAEHYPEVDNVVLFAPTVHRHQGLGQMQEPRSSWTLDGEPLPFISFRDASVGALVSVLGASALNLPVSYRSTYESGVEGAATEAEQAARIPLEDGPEGILVFAGGEDRMWPSEVAARDIAEQRPDAQVHVYPEAGHVVGGPSHVGGLELGGTQEANDRAAAESLGLVRETLAAWHPEV